MWCDLEPLCEKTAAKANFVSHSVTILNNQAHRSAVSISVVAHAHREFTGKPVGGRTVLSCNTTLDGQASALLLRKANRNQREKIRKLIHQPDYWIHFHVSQHCSCCLRTC